MSGGGREAPWYLFPVASVCLCVRMGGFASAHVVRAFVSAITLIDSEKAQMHAIVIIGHQLIFSP